MGNMSSSGSGSGRRRHSSTSRRTHPPPPPPVTPHQEITANPFVYPGAAPYPPPPQYPNTNPPMHYPQYHYTAYYPPPPPVPFPPHHHHHPHMEPGWVTGRGYPCGLVIPQPAPYVEHQKAVTIRNDVNIKKETLKIEPDEENPGRFLVSFTFDATADGCITVFFFAKEVENCIIAPTKEDLEPVTVNFQQGLGQKFRQPAGTGIDFSMFEESEWSKVGAMDVYPLAVKADSSSANHDVSDGTPISDNINSQITQAVFEKKERGEFQVKVVKQILWVNRIRYELQEIYGIGNTTESDVDENDQGKECVICLSEPRDTIVHPCRHMCMCSECAKVLRFQTNRCPICRQPVERLLQINVRPEEINVRPEE